jgi:hypothetical protein
MTVATRAGSAAWRRRRSDHAVSSIGTPEVPQHSGKAAQGGMKRRQIILRQGDQMAVGHDRVGKQAETMLAAGEQIQTARIRREARGFRERRERGPRTAAMQQCAAEPEQQGRSLVLRERVPTGVHDSAHVVVVQEVADVLVFEVLVVGVFSPRVGELAAGFDRVVVVQVLEVGDEGFGVIHGWGHGRAER